MFYCANNIVHVRCAKSPLYIRHVSCSALEPRFASPSPLPPSISSLYQLDQQLHNLQPHITITCSSSSTRHNVVHDGLCQLSDTATCSRRFLSNSSELRSGKKDASNYFQIGTPTASVSNEVAAVQRLMKASGLTYSMHSAGTTVGTQIRAPYRLQRLISVRGFLG